MKPCTLCKISKPAVDYHKDRCSRDGLHTRCKSCKSAYSELNKEKQKIKRLLNLDRIKKQRKEFREKNKDKIRAEKKLFYEKNKEAVSKTKKEYYEKNKEKILKTNKQRREIKIEEYKKRDREYYLNNKDKVKEYRITNRKNIREVSNKWRKKKYREDFKFKYSTLLRCAIRRVYKGISKKSKSSEKIIGCSIDKFIKHIEKQFSVGMTHKNHGSWHIDHIVPISSAKTLEEAEKLCHYTNLQPLWAKDNLRKSNKLI